MMAYWFNPVTWIEIRGWKKWDDEWRSCDEKANKMILDSWRLRPFCFLLKLEWPPRGTCQVKDCGFWLNGIEKNSLKNLKEWKKKKMKNLMNQVHLIFFTLALMNWGVHVAHSAFVHALKSLLGFLESRHSTTFHFTKKKKKEKNNFLLWSKSFLFDHLSDVILHKWLQSSINSSFSASLLIDFL